MFRYVSLCFVMFRYVSLGVKKIPDSNSIKMRNENA